MHTPSTPQGLSPEEAARLLAVEGPNALPSDQHRLFDILLGAIREPMFLLLIAAAVLYLLLGDLHEGLLLLLMVCVTVGITLYQEGKTERALEALRDLSSPRALVLRSGQAVRIPGREVVRGDLLVLSEGDRVAADAVLVAANNLRVDESLLTGEAWPVGKRAAREDENNAPPGGEDLPFVWSGTLVVQGDGIARVAATGAKSELGKIGSSLRDLGMERSPLQRETARVVKVLAVAGFALSLFVAGIYGIVHGQWLQAVLVGIALTMSLLPEEFPVILAVFPAIGAWRMSRAQVLTRRLAAIETLGSISVLCTDKTGTLTENRMKVVCMRAQGQGIRVDGAEHAEPPAPFLALAECAVLASKQQAFDPMEKAFHQLAGRWGGRIDVRPEQSPLREYPLSPRLRAMSQVWNTGEAGRYLVAAKGAPEAIAAMCRLDEAERQAMSAAVDEMARQGLRVLAAARAVHAGTPLPETQEQFDFEYLGLLALADPLRAEIPEAVRQCNEASIRVVMITGDYPQTAASIAHQAGLPASDVLSGYDMDKLDAAQLHARLREVTVCARITPAQKLRIVEALKANGEIVAMTGDGVNDAPALKAAHVGVAMGGRGTDVAREAAALVLLDDNFASIVRGIRLGRRIFANMQNAMSYVLAMHVPIAGMALLPALFGWPIFLYPVHIAFLELIIDPACSIAFENEASDADAMRRPPRDSKAPLISRGMFLLAALQGGAAMLVVAFAYVWSLRTLSENEARAFGYAVLIVANLGLIFSNLSLRRSALHVFRSPNKIPLWVACAAMAVLLLTLYLPAMTRAFSFSPLSAAQMAAAMCLGLMSIVLYEIIKFGLRNAIAVK